MVTVFFAACLIYAFILFFKQKTAYDMRISDWSSDVCSSDLIGGCSVSTRGAWPSSRAEAGPGSSSDRATARPGAISDVRDISSSSLCSRILSRGRRQWQVAARCSHTTGSQYSLSRIRSEEHTSELTSLMRISYAVLRLKNKKT